MTNLNIPVAPGVRGSKPATCCCNCHEVGFILLRGGELSEEIHYESGPGKLNAWQGAQRAFGFSQQVFALACSCTS